MLYVLFALFSLSISDPMILFNNSTNHDNTAWRVVDDVVMGGRSNGSISFNDEGHALYSGYVTTENNGGFSSVRLDLEDLAIQNYSKVMLKVKGDGKRYQFRLKSNDRERHSYMKYFNTSTEWQEIEMDLSAFEPTFRGSKLRIPNFPGEQLSEVAILIANGKKEEFELEIAEIVLLP